MLFYTINSLNHRKIIPKISKNINIIMLDKKKEKTDTKDTAFSMSNFYCINYRGGNETHSPSFPSFHLHHSSFSNPSLALPTSQLILQPFRCFTYATGHFPTLLSLLLYHRIFTYVTWRAAHGSLF